MAIRLVIPSRGFNPSVGILFIQAERACAGSDTQTGFNPSVGILFIQALSEVPCCRNPFSVSIPRSGFCSFKLCGKHRRLFLLQRFNPSVGILFIQASRPLTLDEVLGEFQSLGRDSVHSSLVVSIATHLTSPSFNPSVGILFIQATARATNPVRSPKFQSLGRDSVHSSTGMPHTSALSSVVSIPRSGFCSFKPHSFAINCSARLWFQSSVGILFIQAYILCQVFGTLFSFQSLGRDSVHSSRIHCDHR